jgi:hypothetical protein
MQKKTTVGAVAEGDSFAFSLPKTKTSGATAQPSVQVPDALFWRRHWKNQLHRLHGLPLLAVGAGPDRKAPANLRNGELLGSWPTTTHTPAQIQNAHKKICGAGTRTGTAAQGLLVLDVDGGTAVSWLLERGCDPLGAKTWQIHRNTDNERLKVAWRLNEEQQAVLGELKTKVETRPAVKDAKGKVLEKGQAVEVFHGSGQVVVLGEHPTSKGFYWWPDGMGPEALSPVPECWWKAALEITGNTPAATIKTKTTSSKSNGVWRSLNPCPICCRDSTGYCSQHRDGETIRCFHGNTFNPEHVHGVLKPGHQITDSQGTIWAVAKTEAQANGDVFSVFVTPKPETRRPPLVQPANQLAKPQLPSKLPASLQALIQRQPEGWKNDGKASHLSAGRLADMLLAERFRFDQMELRAYVETSNGWQRITDDDLDSAYVLLSGMGWSVKHDSVVKAILHVARQTPVHPLREYLQRLENDPAIKPYDLAKVAPDLLGAEAALHVAMVRKWLIGAAARAMSPGCQMDYVLVLHGDQGLLKSGWFKALASPDWFCSTAPESEKDFLLNVHSCWIFELAELESITRGKETGKLKNLITTSVDIMRPPYGRTNERLPRSSVFAATCNEETFLKDATGSRRFWVVPIPGKEKLDIAALRAARDGIWKAAISAWRSGELPMLPKELESKNSEQNQQFNEHDPWTDMVVAWMDGEPLHRWDPERDPSTMDYDPEQPFSSTDVLYSAGLKRPDSITKNDQMRVAAVLRGLGFEREKNPVQVDGIRSRRWHLGAQPAQPAQPENPEVVHPQKPATAVGSAGTAQPAQPKREIEKKKAPEHRDGGGDGASVGGLGNKGCAPTPDTAENPVLQGVWGCTTSGAQPTPEVVHLVGTAVEHQAPEGWRNGWTVADVVKTSAGATRYRIVGGGKSLNASAYEIRPCMESA